MSAELDMSQYLDLFLQEADEQLEILEQETLKLEREPSPERLQVIFRAAHTLKGSSRAMGFMRFAELTHEMENVLDKLRNNELAVTTAIADALLGCIDVLSEMKASLAEGKGDQVETGVLVRTLRSFTGGSGAADPGAGPATGPIRSALTPEQRDALRVALTQAPVLHARVRLAPDCAMKYVRAFMAIGIAEEFGELLLTVPDRQTLEDESFDTDFELIVQTSASPQELHDRLAKLSEVVAVEVEPLRDGPAEAGPEARAPSEPPGASPAEASGETPPPAPPTVAAVETPAPRPAEGTKKADSGQTVRVDVARLDNLMNLVGELVIDRTRIAQIGQDLSARYRDASVDDLEETVGHIARITSDLQDQIMKARMMPIETVFNRYPRVVRDLAHKLGKDIRLELEGGDTELDRSVIEVIGDPLLHILRNSVDHGIEGPEERKLAGKPRQGLIRVTARHQENHIVIEIEDDGKGIDAARIRKKAIERGLISAEAAERLTDKEALQLIFASGLSTAEQVSEVSGRGVGMDIVRSNIQRLGGIIDLETEVGRGTKFSLRLPLTLAIIRGLLVKQNGIVYVIPLGSVVETMLVSTKSIQSVNGHEVIVIRGLTTPLFRLGQLFPIGADGAGRDSEDQLFVVVVGLAEQRIGLVVDTLIGEQEVVIKSLSRFCGDVPGVSGATILGDGNVALIVDVNGLFQHHEH